MGLTDVTAYYTLRSSGDNGWYIVPRAQYFNPQNLDEWSSILSWMKEHQYVRIKDLSHYQQGLGEEISDDDYVYAEWDQDLQKQLLDYMVSKGIIRPYAQDQSLADKLANVRNQLNLLKKFGFGFINKERHLHISTIGQDFLIAEADERLRILERQLFRIQFWNPSLSSPYLDRYLKYRLFPYYFILNVLLLLEDHKLTAHEFAIVVAYARTHDDLDVVVELINELRSQSEEALQSYINILDLSFPQTANASVHLGLFGLTPGLHFKGNTLSIFDIDYIMGLINFFEPKIKFVEYKTFEDWYLYISEDEQDFNLIDIMRYYVEVGDDEKAEVILEEVDDERELPSIKNVLENMFQEKLLEDMLEIQIDLLEDGLHLIANGRQFTTEIGRIDLLAKDKDDKYVVVELKKGELEDKVIGQCLRYMGWVKNNLSPGRFVRGIIVGRQISPKLDHALIGMQHPNKDIIITRQLNIDINAQIQ